MPKRERTPGNDKLVPVMMRLPEDLHLWLKQQAEDEHRSLNSQVIVMLQNLKDKKTNYTLSAEPGSYKLTGQDVNLTIDPAGSQPGAKE